MGLLDFFRRKEGAAPAGDAAATAALSGPDAARALDLMREVIDPEVGIDVVDMGLVLRVATSDERVAVDLAMTSAACPMGESMVDDAREVLQQEWPQREIEVRLMRDFRWSPERMSARARMNLGWG